MEGDGAFGSMGISKDDGSVATLDLYWPNEEEQKGLEQMVRSLKTPYLPGSPIEQAILEAGVSVLEGNMSVDEGVAQIKMCIRDRYTAVMITGTALWETAAAWIWAIHRPVVSMNTATV